MSKKMKNIAQAEVLTLKEQISYQELMQAEQSFARATPRSWRAKARSWQTLPWEQAHTPLFPGWQAPA